MIQVFSEQAMKELGAIIGASLAGHELIELVGDVGAGKTTFVRGLAQGMGVEETVQSPSFTISRVYDAAHGKRLAHYDFYRLEQAGIMADELSEVLHDSDTVVVVEWAGAVAEVLPRERLTMVITALGENERRITVKAEGQGAAALERTINDFSA